MKAYLIYPHQLYNPDSIKNLLLESNFDYIVLAEEFLYFKHFDFHPIKVKFHIDTMHAYKLELEKFLGKIKNKAESKTKDVNSKIPKIIYIKSEELNSTEKLAQLLKNEYKIKNIITHDPTDVWLTKHMSLECKKLDIEIEYMDSPNFIFSKKDIEDFYVVKMGEKNSIKKMLMNTFYIHSRKKLNILIAGGEEKIDYKNMMPIGGKWSYDAENRKSIPKGMETPDESHFKWATTRAEAEKVMHQFFKTKFAMFGDYEDAIVGDKNFLYHSTLSAYINVGLLDPKQVVDEALKFYENSKKENKKDEGEIKLATIEGFVRQIIGWREYMRIVYILKGDEIRTKNFFKFDKKLPYTFWTATTGNDVIDRTIAKTIKYAYNHHIERLMILGNYMLLKEYNPDDIYKWFMEMYIDAYDWVMVPNVYSMSQYADGGIITTKPYVSGSAYVKKMSDYKSSSKKEIKSEEWDTEWDNLYWDFIYKNREKFKNNFRMAMMVNMSIKRFEKNKATKEDN